METRRPDTEKNPWKSWNFTLAAALAVGIGILLLWLSGLAGLMLLTDAEDWMLSLTVGIGLLAAGYGMGRFAGFHRRKKGLKTGLLCGSALAGLLFLVGILWYGEPGGVLRPLLLLTSSAFGGISGVHAPHRAPPR